MLTHCSECLGLNLQAHKMCFESIYGGLSSYNANSAPNAEEDKLSNGSKDELEAIKMQLSELQESLIN